MARTPALLVPNTPEGRFYNALADVPRRISEALDATIRQATANPVDGDGDPIFVGSKERLERLLADALNQFSFEDVKAVGMQDVAQIITKLKIFPWDDVGEPLYFEVDRQQLEAPVRRLPNGLYRFSPVLAYALLGKGYSRSGRYGYIDDDNASTKIYFDGDYGVCFSADVAYCLIGDPGWLYTLSGYSVPTRDYVLRPLDFVVAVYNGIRDQKNAWYPLSALHTFTWRQGARGSRVIETLTGNYAGELYPWCTDIFQWPRFIIDFFVRVAEKLNEIDKKQQRGQWIQFGLSFLAIASMGTAINAIGASGATLQNVAQLTASVDNLPGVDLGVVGDIAAGISGGIKLAAGIPGAETMLDFETVDIDFDPSVLEVDLTPADIGANVIDFDESIFADFGLEVGDLIPDDFGNIFTVTGEAVTLDPETYVKTIYIDEGGNYRDFSNNVILSQSEADQVFNESGADNDAVFQRLAEKAQSFAGNAFVAQPGSAARPDGTPAPAAQGQVPWFQALSQEVMGWFKTVTSYSLAKEQLEKTGRYTPPYQTNPNGTPYSQVPGMPVRRADGSTVINNGNGTQTIQYADGRVQTMPTNVNPAQIAGGQLIPGVSNQTLLIAGAGLLAVALLARRT